MNDESIYDRDGPVCPYCKHSQTLDWELDYQEGGYDRECEYCNKNFHVELYVSYSWTSYPLKK